MLLSIINNTSVSMSIEISKIIDVYDQSISIVSAKNELFIDNPSTISSQTEIISRPSQTEFQMWTTYMVRSLKNLLKMWLKKYQMFGMLNMINKVSLDQLHSTLSSLRNNTNLLTKQEQLINQMQVSIKQWNEIKDPLLYYDLKKRQSLKSDMQKKISQLKENSALTKKSEAPMYLRKVQQELKNTIYSVYINQVNIDSKIIERGVCQWQDSIAFVYRQYKELSNLEVFHFVAETRNRFVDMFAEQILRRGKVNDRFFVKYNQEINNAAKNIGKFWTDYRSSFDTLLTITKSYIKIFNQYKQDLRNRQTQVIRYLQKPSPTMSRIFKIDMSLKAITCLNKIFEIIPILTNLESALKNLRNLVNENVQYCTQFRNGIVKNIGIREKDFYICSVDDKNYLDSCVKSQSSIKKKLIDLYAKFLKDIDCISKDNLKLFQKQFVPVYEAHEVGSLLNRQINSHEGQIRMDRSRVSTNSTGQTSIKDLKVIKNQKLSQIELFLSKLQLYDPSSINWSRNNIFSCALGPRLLLHGSMAIMEQGVYFESVFNKKNLFFGRTRIFVPRAEIFEIDTQNTLMIFPDAVELKTKVGSIYFHSLGYRQTISNTLNQVYFPQNVQNGEDCATDIDFNQYQEGQFQKLTSSELQEILKPYENVVIEKIFKGIKLNKFFRRYFGNDTFEIRGNTYENFRNYFLLQIQAIQPKATPITPQPPSYFNYKKQQQPVKNCPKISERYHTYKKAIPKIPFLSSGGEGLCEDKQIYRWVTPQILVVDCVSKVKGFSLVQGMQILTRHILKQENGDVKLNISNSIKFSTQSSTNGLLKGPAQSNLKQSTLKMIQIMQKYEKGKKGRGGKNKEGGNLNEQNELMQENMTKIIEENKKLKRNFKLVVVMFVIIYLLTLLSIRLVYF